VVDLEVAAELEVIQEQQVKAEKELVVDLELPEEFAVIQELQEMLELEEQEDLELPEELAELGVIQEQPEMLEQQLADQQELAAVAVAQEVQQLMCHVTLGLQQNIHIHLLVQQEVHQIGLQVELGAQEHIQIHLRHMRKGDLGDGLLVRIYLIQLAVNLVLALKLLTLTQQRQEAQEILGWA
jgi:hypothetical protein